MLTVSGLADEAMWKNLDPEQALASSGLGENDLGVAISCMELTGPTSLWVQLMSLGASSGRARPFSVSQLELPIRSPQRAHKRKQWGGGGSILPTNAFPQNSKPEFN